MKVSKPIIIGNNFDIDDKWLENYKINEPLKTHSPLIFELEINE